MVKRVLTLALAVMAVSASSSASPQRFDARAELRPSRCNQKISGTVVTLDGCFARARFSGSARGTLEIAYSARVDIARGGGSQHGTITLRGASAHDLLVLRFAGAVVISTGSSRGTWKAVERTGSFARAAPPAGTYTSTTPDQGAHVSFDVRG